MRELIEFICEWLWLVALAAVVIAWSMSAGVQS